MTHYENNKETYKARAKSRREHNAKFVYEYKESLSCVICGESDSCCLDFHHLDPSLKDRDITRAAWNGWSVDRLLEEINKCVVLCSNCHRKLHAGHISLV